MLEVTNIRIKKLNTVPKNDKCVLAYVSIELNNCLAIHNIKIVQISKDKRILSFPNKKVPRYEYDKRINNYEAVNEYSDIVHPINREFRQYLEDILFKMYDKEDNVNE